MLAEVFSEKSLAYLSTIFAFGAWWLTWRESVRNNNVMVTVTKLSCVVEDSICAPRQNRLEVCIHNKGVQLVNISMSLSFYGPRKSGTVSVPLKLLGLNRSAPSILLRKMTAQFGISSIDHKDTSLLSLLSDLREQRPQLHLFNDAFHATTFPIWSRWDPIKRWWNMLSFKLEFNRRVGEGVKGGGVFHPVYLPRFSIKADALSRFTSLTKKNQDTQNTEN
jgi:hypothetical protein